MGIAKRYRMYKTAAVLAVIAGTAAAAFSFSAPAQEETVSAGHFSQEQVHVTVPGMEGSCTILWISDMHICCYPEDEGVTPEHAQEVRERYEFLQDQQGITSRENWKLLSGQIDSYGADYIVFGADMIDYASAANLDALGEGLERVRTPWMYIRADHDYARWYGEMGIRKMRRLHRRIAPQNKIWIQRFDEFTLIGLDNTTTAISEETLQQFREICEEGKPVLLCTHVPVDQRLDGENPDSLAAASQADWGGRILCWGEGDEYDTSAFSTMAELTELIYAPDSPVIAVLAGHLHLTWEGNLTESCMEHVFSAAYEGSIGVITVSG